MTKVIFSILVLACIIAGWMYMPRRDRSTISKVVKKALVPLSIAVAVVVALVFFLVNYR